MSSTLIAAASARATAVRPGVWSHDRRFFTGIASVALLTVFAGFARTYYLKTYTGTPALSPLVHLHGIVFSAWIVLFVVQTSLVAVRRTDVHRRLGVAGGALAVLMIVVGLMTAVAAARRGFNAPGANLPDALAFMIVPIRDLLMFSILVGAGLYYRRRADTHKRLLLLATINVLPAAISRIPLVMMYPALIPVAILAFLLAGSIDDAIVRRRVHPVYIWGGALTIVTTGLQFAIGPTAAWHAFARWLIA